MLFQKNDDSRLPRRYEMGPETPLNRGPMLLFSPPLSGEKPTFFVDFFCHKHLTPKKHHDPYFVLEENGTQRRNQKPRWLPFDKREEFLIIFLLFEWKKTTMKKLRCVLLQPAQNPL